MDTIRKNKILFTFHIVADSKLDAELRTKIYVRLKINGVKRDINTGIKWPPAFFDKQKEELMPRYKNDPDVKACNLKINHYKAIAHRLDVDAFTKNKSLTLKNIVDEFNLAGSAENFFSFYEAQALQLKTDKFFQEKTYFRHISTLNTFRNFLNGSNFLPINNIDLALIEKFNHYALTVLKMKHNTVSGYHKDLKKYLGIAKKKGLIHTSPYEEFKFKYVPGEREVLDNQELLCLFNLYKNEIIEVGGKVLPLPPDHKEVLRRFLFSCVTGIRLSDTHHITVDNVANNQLTFKVAKGFYRSGKIQKIPLSKVAFKLIEGRKGKLFNKMTDQHINQLLKFIAGWAGISKTLSFHVSRGTFATQYLRMGGDIETCSKILGHSNIKTTAIYVRMNMQDMQEAMDKFNKYL